MLKRPGNASGNGTERARSVLGEHHERKGDEREVMGLAKRKLVYKRSSRGTET
jgi:hypothetical protein